MHQIDKKRITDRISIAIEDFSDSPSFPNPGYVPEIDGHRSGRVFDTLDQAIIGGLVIQYRGDNSNDAAFIIIGLGMVVPATETKGE